MKKISPAIVLIKDIHSSQPRSVFSEAELEKAAQLILAIEGVINPIVLMRTGVTAYEVVNGHFEYYAALKAKEINSIKGETINAYIIESADEQEIFEQQIAVFRRSHHWNDTPEITHEVKPSHLDKIAKRLQTLEEQFSHLTKNINNEIKGLWEEIGTLTPPEPVLTEPVAEEPIDTPPAKPMPTIPSNEETIVNRPKTPEEQFLEILNTLPIRELALKLSKIKGIKQDLSNKIEAARRKKSFESLNDIKSRKIGVGGKTLEKIMERLLQSGNSS